MVDRFHDLSVSIGKYYTNIEINGGSNLPCKYLFSNVEVYARVAARMKYGRRMPRKGLSTKCLSIFTMLTRLMLTTLFSVLKGLSHGKSVLQARANVSKDMLRMNGMKVNKCISEAIFTGPDRGIYRTHLYRTYFGQGLGYVQDKT